MPLKPRPLEWLEPEKSTAPAVAEAILVDHYLWALPYKAKRIISQQSLTTADLTVEAVEKYQATTEVLPGRSPGVHPRLGLEEPIQRTPRSPTPPPQELSMLQGEPEGSRDQGE